MALTRTNRLSDASATFYGTGSWTSSAFTPSANSLLVVSALAVHSVGEGVNIGDALTISGGGLTFTSRVVVNDTTYWGSGLVIFTAPVGGSPSSMTLTLDCGANDIYNYRIHVVDYTGYDASTPTGATASTTAGATNGAASLTLSAAPATSSEVIATLDGESVNSINTATPGSGWTEIYDTGGSAYRVFQSQIRTGSTSTSVDWSDVSDDAGGLYGSHLAALEIRAAAGGATYSRRKKRITPSQVAPFNPQQFARRRGSTANPVVTRSAVASLDLAVQLARQSTASIDAAVQAPRSATAAVDLATQAMHNVTAALDTALQVANALTTSLQAAVQTSPAATASLDIAVQAARNATAGLDAALQIARAATTSIDLSVQAPTSAIASLDLQVQAGTSLSAALQLAVLATANASSAIDLAVQRPLNATATLGLAVQQALNAAATLDIAVQAARSAGAAIDLQVQSGTSVAAALSAAVQASAAAQTQLGLAVQDAHVVAAAIDLALALQRNSTAALDAAITRAQSASAGLSLYVFAEQFLVHGERGYAVRDTQPARSPQRARGRRMN